MIKFLEKKIKNKKGFSLIELVVVIAILGILAAVVVPRMSITRTNAANAAHNANVRTLESAAILALAENGNPNEDIVWEESTRNNDTTEWGWKKYLQNWPEVPKGARMENGNDIIGEYTVRITKNGEIEVNITPAKSDTVD